MTIYRNVITTGKVDSEFLKELIESGAEKILLCVQCGTCTASCPSGRRTAYRTRQVIRKALLGLKEEVLSSEDIWYCTTCYTCLERCPRGIDVTDVILLIRNAAVRDGHMLPPHRETSHRLIQTGHAVPIDDKNRLLRRELALSELPPTTHSHPEALKEVQKIAKKLKFYELTGFKEG